MLWLSIQESSGLSQRFLRSGQTWEAEAEMGYEGWQTWGLVAYLIPLRRTEVAWMPSDLPSPEEAKRLHLFKQILFETNSFWNKFQYLTSHTGIEGQLLQDTQLHRGLGNCDFIKHWNQPTFMYCQEGCPAPWCCPWPQRASHSFPFTSLLCPWPTVQGIKPALSPPGFVPQ